MDCKFFITDGRRRKELKLIRKIRSAIMFSWVCNEILILRKSFAKLQIPTYFLLAAGLWKDWCVPDSRSGGAPNYCPVTEVVLFSCEVVLAHNLYYSSEEEVFQGIGIKPLL